MDDIRGNLANSIVANDDQAMEISSEFTSVFSTTGPCNALDLSSWRRPSFAILIVLLRATLNRLRRKPRIGEPPRYDGW